MTTLRPTPISISITMLAALPMVGAGCDRPAAKYAAVDQPDPVPQAKAPPPPKVDAKSDPAKPGAGECTRGTGRNAAGECVPLATRQQGPVQQVQIPAGKFVVGDAPADYDFGKSVAETKLKWAGQPPRMADSAGFWIDMHEVTREAYQACVDAKKCTAPVCDPAERLAKIPAEAQPGAPQTCVTHPQAEAYCKAQGGRLPTEVEWEYAARGVDARLYPWGSEIRDEFMLGLLPVATPLNDTGYFGVRGQGTNATEWVADVFDANAPLAAYVPTPFREPDGPLMRALAEQPPQHVFKSARVGDRYGEDDADALLGFRCAADLGSDVAPLTVPVNSVPIPILREAGPLFVFGGIAEVVSHAEAEAFCAAVSVERGNQIWSDWRLPTLAEVLSIVEGFRGPGPFWTAADGVILQESEGPKKTPIANWVSVPKADGVAEVAAARCVHDPLPPR